MDRKALSKYVGRTGAAAAGKEPLQRKDVETAQTEALSSALIAPFENVLLSSLAALSEESNGIMRELFGRRAGQNYMAQAESEGLLPSAAAFQDCLNIRHLMHHQWDTLDGIGKFNERETVKTFPSAAVISILTVASATGRCLNASTRMSARQKVLRRSFRH